ncbi:MAG TPA: MauE/DoxX family redox-associated membrane protein [Candidatus Binatia bacterium]|nr:MauE/DoxX family redox-associated membrane protein [Candidatus Binatia bacterium]
MIQLVIDPVVDATMRAGLALLFVVAASHKLRDPARFRATVVAYRVLPEALAPVVATLLVLAELGVAVALAVPPARTAALAGAGGLLLVYAGALGVNVVRGRDLDCGCAGPAARQPINGWLVGRNVVLAAAALAALVPVRPRSLVWIDVLTVIAATAALALLHASVDRLIAQAPRLAALRSRA